MNSHSTPEGVRSTCEHHRLPFSQRRDCYRECLGRLAKLYPLASCTVAVVPVRSETAPVKPSCTMLATCCALAAATSERSDCSSFLVNIGPFF